MTQARDHGGRLDAAIARYGGCRADWLDLSTGINPVPYPVGTITSEAWQCLPDQSAFDDLYAAARRFWRIPESAGLIAATGASAIIAALPHILPPGPVHIPGPTYNEHEAAFRAAGRALGQDPGHVVVAVHPNNPDGRLWQAKDLDAPFVVVDESFCDTCPDLSHINLAARPGNIILKSFGKFWGLAGLRLGFAVGDPVLINRLADMLGPWQTSGPALQIGKRALQDAAWAAEMRDQLHRGANRLDDMMQSNGAQIVGGTSLFRTYRIADAAHVQDQLARHFILSRAFPYSSDWLRLGLPAPDRWDQLERAL